jgi:hypothetical protein
MLTASAQPAAPSAYKAKPKYSGGLRPKRSLIGP